MLRSSCRCCSRLDEEVHQLVLSGSPDTACLQSPSSRVLVATVIIFIIIIYFFYYYAVTSTLSAANSDTTKRDSVQGQKFHLADMISVVEFLHFRPPNDSQRPYVLLLCFFFIFNY